jgi:2-polyprenyl-3-methyl-5-hydroxy-6-metoxy-1,4-benzoquinol methylase
MTSGLDPIVASFQREVTAHLRRLGADPGVGAVQTTIATNSTLIEQRGRPLVAVVCAALQRVTLDGVRILDLGCGYGALSALLASSGASVLGIDVDPQRLDVGRQIVGAHGLDVELRAGRMERPLLAHGSFDVVLANNSLCYVVDPAGRERVLREAYRSLRPDGLLVIRDPNRLHPRDNFTGLWLVGLLSDRAANRVASLLGRRRSRVRLRTPRSSRGEVQRAGFLRARTVSPGGLVRRQFAGYNILTAWRPLA